MLIRVLYLQEASDNIDRANAGVAPVSGAPVNNDKYANGVATESHSNANDSIATTNSNVDATLTITLKAPSPSTGFEWVGDALHIGYELLTYFPVFGAVDVLVQYGYGKIGGYTALGLLGLNLIPGGKVGGKVFGEGIERYTSYTRLRDRTPSYRKNTNYSISTTKEEFISNLEYNGYTTTNGKKYTNGGIGHYEVYDARTSTGFAGGTYVRSKSKRIKYSLGVMDL